ncbi:PAS domain-containing protein [Mucilaginibacter sp. Bleaf8]|uniref:GAF domain-containing protein n=1 Tax=Mucilaginibacter sp. Bleaf8 TaxID=2834430 RepID=UPI001BCBC063|nr:GAF domain-containing protein [Mucilaginibacter sp. Bleaf8]MBS7565039.1 PAS domain-containing protein [Mucilaginibacter sp. Bleaf8]
MPLKELSRLQAINRFLTLEVGQENELEKIVELAADICGTPAARITFLDEELAHLLYKTGVELSYPDPVFCQYAVKLNDILEITDAILDEQFNKHAAVIGDDAIRFYAGAPLTRHDGVNIGTICVLDRQPKCLSKHQKQMLSVLSRQVIHLLEFELSINILKQQFIEAKQAEITLRSFFESTQSCHVLIDRDMQVLAFNKAFSQFIHAMYGIEVELRMKATDYIEQMYIPDFIANFNHALTGQSVKTERLLEFGSKKTLWCQFCYDPAFDRDGDIVGISFNVNNITELKRNEQQIIEQNKALRRIAYFQSHELRKPVASILGLMNVVKLDGYGHNQEALTMMEEAVQELDDVIHRIVNNTIPLSINEAIFPTLND